VTSTTTEPGEPAAGPALSEERAGGRVADDRVEDAKRLWTKGGSSALVDGFSAAARLRAEDPDTGHRHLQGCYTDLDGLASTLALLDHDHQGQERA
jgi:hypothetical protein